MKKFIIFLFLMGGASLAAQAISPETWYAQYVQRLSEKEKQLIETGIYYYLLSYDLWYTSSRVPREWFESPDKPGPQHKLYGLGDLANKEYEKVQGTLEALFPEAATATSKAAEAGREAYYSPTGLLSSGGYPSALKTLKGFYMKLYEDIKHTTIASGPDSGMAWPKPHLYPGNKIRGFVSWDAEDYCARSLSNIIKNNYPNMVCKKMDNKKVSTGSVGTIRR